MQKHHHHENIETESSRSKEAETLIQRVEQDAESFTERAITPEWRMAALERVFEDLVAIDATEGRLRKCWVPREAARKISEEEACDGYPSVMVEGISYPAHNVVLALIHNRLVDTAGGEQGNHECDNPMCRKPTHLIIADHASNMKAMAKRKRAATDVRNGHFTMPEKTPRGDTHYRTRLKGLKHTIAIQLLKKYGDCRGFAQAIAKELETTASLIYNLKRLKLHLLPGVEETDIELKLVPRCSSSPKIDIPDARRKTIAEIRRRFHSASAVDRSWLLRAMAEEYGYVGSYIRRILKREIFNDIAPEIPVPSKWGVGRRRSFKRKPRLQ